MGKGRFATDLIGKRFNRLTVIGRAENAISPRGSQQAVWVCKCDCGTIKNVRGLKLKSNNTKSCGCLQKETAKENGLKLARRVIKLEKGIGAFNVLYSVYVKTAKAAKIQFLISKEDFKILTSANCHYCGESPLSFKITKTSNGGYYYNGLDRKSGYGDYSLDNVVTCCKICNFAKRNLTEDEFISHIKKIYEHTLSK